jgi:hypothetical protein
MQTSYIPFVMYVCDERLSEDGTVDIATKRNRRLQQKFDILFVTYLGYECVTERDRGERN